MADSSPSASKDAGIDTLPDSPRPPYSLIESAARVIPDILANVQPLHDGTIEMIACDLAMRLQDAKHTRAAAHWAIHEFIQTGRLRADRVQVGLPCVLIPGPGGMTWQGPPCATKAIPRGKPAPFDCFKVVATESLWTSWRSLDADAQKSEPQAQQSIANPTERPTPAVPLSFVEGQGSRINLSSAAREVETLWSNGYKDSAPEAVVAEYYSKLATALIHFKDLLMREGKFAFLGSLAPHSAQEKALVHLLQSPSKEVCQSEFIRLVNTGIDPLSRGLDSFLSKIFEAERMAAVGWDEHGDHLVGARPIEQQGAGITRITWQQVAEKLERLRAQGEPWTSFDKMARQIGCAKATVKKAVDCKPALRAWAKRPAAPRAQQGLDGPVIDNAAQQRELAPEEEAAIREFIDHADEEERIWFLGLSVEDQLNYLDDPDPLPKDRNRSPKAFPKV
jgi:hypothetical protein